MYSITYSPEAKDDLARLKQNEPAYFKKAVKLLNEIIIHPRTGTGHPEPLKGLPEGRWSRTISKNIVWYIAYSKQKSILMYFHPMVTITINRNPYHKKSGNNLE